MKANAVLGLMLAIRKLPGAEYLRVFGSAGRGAESPADLDIVIDQTLAKPEDSRIMSDLADSLLWLARQNYGSLDPFVLTADKLLVRNDHATGYMSAMNAAGLIRAINTDGVSLDEAISKALAHPGNRHAPVCNPCLWRGKRAVQWLFPGKDGWQADAGGPRAGEAVAIVGREIMGSLDMAYVRSYQPGRGHTEKAYTALRNHYGVIRAVEVTPDGEGFQQHMIEKKILAAMTREDTFPTIALRRERAATTDSPDLAI